MAQFASDTRRWLEAVIKQRKLLLKINKSHKPEHEVMMAIHNLETLLSTYSYSNDLYMARFICQNVDNIETLLPGSGSAACRKKQLEFNLIRYNATLIVGSQGSCLRLTDSITKSI